MAAKRSAEKNVREGKIPISRDQPTKSRTVRRSAKTGEFVHVTEGRGKVVETKKGVSAKAGVRGYSSTVMEPVAAHPARKVKAKASAPVVKANYPYPPSSPEFTRLLVQCFVDARNAAIDELNSEKASGS